MCNDGLSAEAAELLAEILLSDGVAPLTLFHFYNNMGGNGSGVAIGKIITACQQLEDLRFSATRSMAEGCLAIAAVSGSFYVSPVLFLTTRSFLSRLERFMD